MEFGGRTVDRVGAGWIISASARRALTAVACDGSGLAGGHVDGLGPSFGPLSGRPPAASWSGVRLSIERVRVAFLSNRGVRACAPPPTDRPGGPALRTESWALLVAFVRSPSLSPPGGPRRGRWAKCQARGAPGPGRRGPVAFIPRPLPLEPAS